MYGLWRGVINFPETYDQDGNYTFSVSQGGDAVSVSWDGLNYRGFMSRGSGGAEMGAVMKGPSCAPPAWRRTVLDRAYPSGASIPGLFRNILDQVTSRCVVTLTYPEHGLYPRAVRALADGLKELNQVIMENDLPMLVLVETASVGFLDDLTSPNEQGSLCDRVVFTTYDGFVSVRSIDEHYLGMFSLGSDLYLREQEVVAGRRPDAPLEEVDQAQQASDMLHSIIAGIISQGQRTTPVPSLDGEAAIDFVSRLFSIVEVEAGEEVTHVVVGRTAYEALRSAGKLWGVDEFRAPNPNARLWWTLVFSSSSIPDNEVIVAAYGSEGAVVERGLLTR